MGLAWRQLEIGAAPKSQVEGGESVVGHQGDEQAVRKHSVEADGAQVEFEPDDVLLTGLVLRWVGHCGMVEIEKTGQRLASGVRVGQMLEYNCSKAYGG